ncbi:response regulator [Candidatus Uabimicrobium amorphum]|uniref:Response regulatory domain-containing protein n=1 Tax=Uabimicrobium amorphum TaxID=2596890 RepID=A0A5S9IU35_UABAM|nr:response regulator [Candidatus Uabimicrobium amorphum]BBM88129.1 hypothetical protein UABAM_06545 [Candidatus Uabimicrobium amorphum]
MHDKKGFTTGEVAELCHVTIPTVIKWIESNELEGFKIPGSKNRRITRENLIKFMKKHNIPIDQLQKNRPKILAVDDEEIILEVFQGIFDEDSYDIRCVSRGFDAGLAKEFKPDVIILDICLPDIDGNTVCEYVRNMPEMKNVRILGISGNITKKELNDLKKRNFDDILAKPFDNDLLFAKVEKLLRK